MRRLSLILVILCGCSAESVPDAPVVFRGTKAGIPTDEAAVPEFHYLTYDYMLGSWVGELGGHAVPDSGSPGSYVPSDATRVYWPEGKTYSFYAVSYNSNQPVSGADVEFGSAVMIFSSATNAVLTVKNPNHNVDWLAAKNIRQSKINGIPLVFKHVCSKISSLDFDMSAYWEWLGERELDIASINVVWVSLTDADEQTFIYSGTAGSMFNRESWDYSGSPGHTLDDGALPYFAFPGRHTLSLRVQTLDASGNQCIDDRVLSGVVDLEMGADCSLAVRINPDDRPLSISVVTGIAPWQSGGSGIVNE